ncbi:hypothetical protein Tco_0823492, partial [Tanacetum coccineum]
GSEGKSIQRVSCDPPAAGNKSVEKENIKSGITCEENCYQPYRRVVVQSHNMFGWHATRLKRRRGIYLGHLETIFWFKQGSKRRAWDPGITGGDMLKQHLEDKVFLGRDIETTRHVSVIAITLSTKELDTSSIGYQPPLPADQVKVATEFDHDGEGSPTARGRGRGGRGRGRGRSRAMSGNGYGQGEYNDRGWDAPREFTRGRGQGRGRNFRDRGRGGYNNGPYVDDQYDGLQGRAIDVRKMFSERTDWPHLYWTMDNIIKNDENGVLENSMAIGRLGYCCGQMALAEAKGRGRGRGIRGRGRGFRSNGPTQAAAGDV